MSPCDVSAFSFAVAILVLVSYLSHLLLQYYFGILRQSLQGEFAEDLVFLRRVASDIFPESIGFRSVTYFLFVFFFLKHFHVLVSFCQQAHLKLRQKKEGMDSATDG